MKKFTAIILAAGKGRRMKSNRPKVLQELNGKPLIYYILKEISALKKHIGQIVIVVGHGSDLVKKYVRSNFKDIDFVIQKDISGTASAVKCTKSKVRCENVLVICGDSPLITKDLIDSILNFHLEKKEIATLVSACMEYKNELGVVLRDKKGKISAVCERVDCQGMDMPKEVNSGIYCFDKDVMFKTISQIKINKRKKEYFFTDIIEVLYKSKYRINAYFLEDFEAIVGVNSKKDLMYAQDALRKRYILELMDRGVVIIDLQTTFISHGVKIGKNTVIYPFTFIERDVIIGSNCSVGPFVHIRGKTRIDSNVQVGNFLEINRSKLGKGVKVKHFGYLGDTDVGDNANIGAGTVIANFDGKNKHKTNIGKNAFIGSDTILVAPVSVGEKGVTGAGSVVTKTVKPNTVVVGVPAKILKKRKR